MYNSAGIIGVGWRFVEEDRTTAANCLPLPPSTSGDVRDSAVEQPLLAHWTMVGSWQSHTLVHYHPFASIAPFSARSAQPIGVQTVASGKNVVSIELATHKKNKTTQNNNNNQQQAANVVVHELTNAAESSILLGDV